MSRLSPERSATLTSRVLGLHRLGYTVPQIAKQLNQDRPLVERVLRGLDAFKRLDSSYLRGLPTISDEAFAEMGRAMGSGAPRDEAKTTEEIYAAAAAIRAKRPREPVGFQVHLVEMAETTFMGGERRGRSVA